jgi:hypothetical protein
MGAWPIYGLYMGAWQGSRAAGYRVPDPYVDPPTLPALRAPRRARR